jgi:Protein of unknown function (DUF2975)
MAKSAPRFPAVGPLGRLSAFMCVVVAVGGALAELALIWVWLSPGTVEMFMVPRLGLGAAPVALDGWTRLAGFLVCMVPMAVLGYLLHQAYELFDSYRLGNVFTATAPVRLRRIGFCMVALAILRPLTATLLGLLLTMVNPPGQRILAIGLSLDDYMIAAFGGLILAIGHVMVEAKRLADENRQIV